MTRYDFLGASTSDSEQCSYQLQLVNSACELGQIMARYDFLWTRKVFKPSPA